MKFDPFHNPFEHDRRCREVHGVDGGTGQVLTSWPSPPTSCSVVLPTQGLTALMIHLPKCATSSTREQFRGRGKPLRFLGPCLLVDPARLRAAYSFTFVRDPMARARSGLVEMLFREALREKRRPQTFVQGEVEAIVDTWLGKLHRRETFKDSNHIHPQSALLQLNLGPGGGKGGKRKQRRTLYPKFFGRVEQFEEYWAVLAGELGIGGVMAGGKKAKGQLKRPMEEHAWATSKLPGKRALDAQVGEALRNVTRVRQICDLYRQDFVCFQYPLPPECSLYGPRGK